MLEMPQAGGNGREILEICSHKSPRGFSANKPSDYGYDDEAGGVNYDPVDDACCANAK